MENFKMDVFLGGDIDNPTTYITRPIESKNSLERLTLICDCSSLEHQISFLYDKDDAVLHCEPHLITSRGFFKRLWYGLKYAFGYKCRYGAFDSVIFTPNELKKLRKYLDANAAREIIVDKLKDVEKNLMFQEKINEKRINKEFKVYYNNEIAVLDVRRKINILLDNMVWSDIRSEKEIIRMFNYKEVLNGKDTIKTSITLDL